MLATVFRFELAYWARRPMAYLFVALFFLLGFFTTGSEAFLSTGGSAQIHRNAPHVLALSMAILTAIGQIVTTAIAGTAVLRDGQVGAQELVFTTRLGKMDYLLGRFLGALGIMAVIYAAIPVGLALGTLMPWVPAEQLGPFSIRAFVQPFLIIVLPNVLFVSALFFAIGALTRKLFAVYVSGIVLFVLWQVTQTLAEQLDKVRLAAILDPFAITTIDSVARYWSVAERNSSLVTLSGDMLVNRILWIGVAFALLGAAMLLVRLVLSRGATGDKARTPEISVASKNEAPGAGVSGERMSGSGRASGIGLSGAQPALQSMRRVTTELNHPLWRRAILPAALFHFRSIVREAPFLAIVAIAVLQAGINFWFSTHYSNGDALWPVTSRYAPVIGTMLLFMLLIATIYGGELVWRDRQVKADQIVDSLPVPPWVGYTARLLAVFLAVTSLLVAVMAVSMAMQLVQGYTRLEPLLYLEVLAAELPTVLALTALTMGVHAIVNQKYAGHLIVVAYWVIMGVAANFGVDHLLSQIGMPPDFTLSDLNGWGPYIPRVVTVSLYSLAACLIVALVGYFFLARGTDTRAAVRSRVGRVRFAAGGWVPTTILVGCAVLPGASIYYNANVLNDYAHVRDAERKWAEWEKLYKPLSALPQPRRVAVSIRHDFYPESRSASWQGEYKSVNLSGRYIDTLFITLRASAPIPMDHYSSSASPGIILDSLSFDRGAELIDDNTPYGVRLYRISPPLAPDESLTVHFAGRFEPRGFPNGGFNNDVAANGSFMDYTYMPRFGYDDQMELSGDDTRKRNGLEPKERMPSIDDPVVRTRNYLAQDADWVTFEETTCTSPDQTAIAPGYLEREWVENGRRCFHYVMDEPILDFFSALSGRYEVTREVHNGVAIEIYHHPWHTFAVPEMLQASKDGLDYFSANFSPYQYRQYRVIEYPQYKLYAQSFPNTIPFSEGTGFLHRERKGEVSFSGSYFVTAHELAHQWWAHQVVGGYGQGATLLSEGLAEYSALTVLEKRYGHEVAQRFLRRELDGYLRGRASEAKKEVPLLFVEDQPYIHYEKGSLVLYALRDYIGEERMNLALRSFLTKWAFRGPPYPTARDLLAELTAVTPDSVRYVLSDLFEEMTFFENKADSAVVRKAGDGSWEVLLAVSTRKFKGDSLGGMTPVPMADYVDVGIFGREVPGRSLGAPLLVKKVRLTDSATVLRFSVREEPVKAGIDPYNKLIDRTPEDNVIAVRKR